MSFRPALFRRAIGVASLAIPCVAFVGGLAPAVGQAQIATEAEPAAGATLTVPPVPDGTPEELMAFVKGLMPPKARPRSREEMMGYMRGVASASVQVADKILAQVKPDDPFATEAGKLKLESLSLLGGRLGDEQAMKDLVSYATALAGGTNAELAKEAKRMLFVSKAQEMFSLSLIHI